jgi:probable F420-dependent oxidoreductase
MGTLGLGPVGVALNVSGSYLAEAAEAERLGYSAIWLPGGQLDELGRLAGLVQATTAVPVGASIISPDVYPAGAVSALYRRLEASAPGRFIPGLGGSQQPRSLAALRAYLDQLDQAGPPVPAGRRLLAALGPRKLELARDRCAGAIVLLVTLAYLAEARRILGAQATLVVDQMLVLDTDPGRARETARRPLRFLAGLPGYQASFARMGLDAADTDRLADELIFSGDPGTVAARIGQLHEAGADHVILHVLSEGGQPGPIEAARALAGR